MQICRAIAFASGTAVLLFGLKPASAQSFGPTFRPPLPTPQLNECDRRFGVYLAGCHPPSNDPCDPNYAGYRVSQTPAMLAQQQCAAARQQHQRQLQAQADEQQRQEVAQQAELRQQSEQQGAIDKAITRGYALIPTVSDLILDGKGLASRNAKIQISGIYKKVGDSERLYAKVSDSIRNNDSYFPVLTDNAARDFRKFLLNQPICQEQSWGNVPGCSVDVGGHMTMCHRLAAEFANYPEVPCLSIEVQIVYRPGD